MSSSQSDQNAKAAAPAGKPVSMGDVAKKITSRTTDLLAMAIVLAASLTFGSQIIWWWQNDAPPPSPAGNPALAPPGWEDGQQSVDLEFGDLPLALTRQTVVGDQPAAIEALVGHCRSIVQAAAAPANDPDEAEIRLLERIADLTPIAQETGAWQVFVVDDRFPFVAAVTLAVSRRPTEKNAATDADLSRRLICYGLAMPAGEQLWTLLIVKGAPAGSNSSAGSPDIPLPPGAARTLSLRDSQGSVLLGFAGKALASEWITFYEDLAEARGWTRLTAWSAGNESWAARFARRDRGWVDIRLANDRRGELTGVLQVIPQISEQIETRP
jgi:hypothetical protein